MSNFFVAAVGSSGLLIISFMLDIDVAILGELEELNKRR